ncbi:MAG: hypothetical protein Q9160_002137 [Pyrenula sp. 1 TL-2023]
MAATAVEQLPTILGSPLRALRSASVRALSRTPDKPSIPFRPPDTLPIRISDSEVRSAFQSAVTGNLDSELKNNASLEAKDILKLARQIYKNPTIRQTTYGVDPDLFSAEYEVTSEDYPEDLIFVDITNAKSALTAQTMMASHLGRFQRDVSEVIKRSEKALGQVALRTEKDIFWVRDAMWIQLFIEHNHRWVKKTRKKPVETFKGAFSGRNSNKAAMYSMLRFAMVIDSYLAKDAVSPAQQQKPETEVGTSSYTAVCGQSFVVKLAGLLKIHKISRVEVQNPSVVVQTENEDPNAKGECTFFANEQGQTKVKIVVARTDNFATGIAEIEVKVKDG